MIERTSSNNIIVNRGVSVVIPCFNAVAYLERAVDSLRQQDGVDVEIIVIDDGSTDGTVGLLEALTSVNIWETGPNRGACAARNRGLLLASSPYIMFLDSDDYLEKNTLKGLVSTLHDSECMFAMAPMVTMDSSGNRILRQMPRNDQVTNFIVDWVYGRYLAPCSILWRTKAVRSLGGWNESLSKNQDGDLVLRAVLAGGKVGKSDWGASVYWCHDGADRISNSINEKKLRDSFNVFSIAYVEMQERGMRNNEVEKAFSYATHSLERMASRNYLHAIQTDIRSFRKKAGWPVAEGPIGHVLLSRLIGLNCKERLAQRLRSLTLFSKRHKES